MKHFPSSNIISLAYSTPLQSEIMALPRRFPFDLQRNADSMVTKETSVTVLSLSRYNTQPRVWLLKLLASSKAD